MDEHIVPPDRKTQPKNIPVPFVDIEAERAFDDLASLAAQIFGLPMAFISLADGQAASD